MRATLIFNLPDDQESLDMAQKAGSYYNALFDLSNQIRNWTKYESKEAIKIEDLRERFYEILNDNEVEI